MLVVHAADRSKASPARLIKLTDLVLVYRQLSAPVVPGADHTIDKQRFWRDEMTLYRFLVFVGQYPVHSVLEEKGPSNSGPGLTEE